MCCVLFFGLINYLGNIYLMCSCNKTKITLNKLTGEVPALLQIQKRSKLRTLKICYSTYNQGSSPPAITFRHLTPLPSTPPFLTLSQVDTNIFCQEGTDLILLKNTHSTNKFSETDIINMLEFLIDNIFVMLGERVFQKTVGIPMGTNCAPPLADMFIYSYEADFIKGLLKKNEKKLARSFNFTFRYNNSRFGDFVDLHLPH